MNLGKKKCSHRNLGGMFRWMLLIMGEIIQKNYLSKLMSDNIRDSIIVNLTENKFNCNRFKKLNS